MLPLPILIIFTIQKLFWEFKICKVLSSQLFKNVFQLGLKIHQDRNYSLQVSSVSLRAYHKISHLFETRRQTQLWSNLNIRCTAHTPSHFQKLPSAKLGNKLTFLFGLFLSLLSGLAPTLTPSVPRHSDFSRDQDLFSAHIWDCCCSPRRSGIEPTWGGGGDGLQSTHEAPPLTKHTPLLEEGFKPLSELLPRSFKARWDVGGNSVVGKWKWPQRLKKRFSIENARLLNAFGAYLLNCSLATKQKALDLI